MEAGQSTIVSLIGKMATQKAAQYAVKLVPVVGEFLSEVLVDIDNYLKNGKEVEAKVEELKKSLVEWEDKLNEVKCQHDTPSIQALEKAILDFKAFVFAWKPPRKRDKLLNILGYGPSKHDTFTDTYYAFEKNLDNLKLVIMVEILRTIVENHEELRQKMEDVDGHLTENHEEVTQQLRGVDQHVTEGGEMLLRKMRSIRNAIPTRIEAKEHIKVPKEWQDALYAFKAGNDKQKREAKLKLMKWVDSGLDPQNAIDVSLAFVRDEDGAAQTLGFQILAVLIEDPKKQKKVLRYSTLSALLRAAQDLTNGPAKDGASKCINELLVENSEDFFKQYKEIDCAITDEDAIRKIIGRAGNNDQALDVLAKLATYNNSKPVIGKMGGVAAMVKIYMENEEMTKDEFNANVSPKILLAIDVLASLAEDEACRGKFAEVHTNIWPLVHFAWNCSYLSTHLQYANRPKIVEWERGDDGDGIPIYEDNEGYQPEVTKFGKQVKEWEGSARYAGKALCTISSDKRCQHLFFGLRASINVTEGNLFSKMEMSSRTEDRHLILGWVAIAAFLLAKATWDKNAKDWTDPKTKTEVCFLRIAWNLLSSENVNNHTEYCLPVDDDSKYYFASEWPLLFENIFEDSGVDQQQCNRVLANCDVIISSGKDDDLIWIQCLALNMLIWKTLSLESSHARIARMAAKSVIKIDDRFFKNSVEHVLKHSKPSEMNSSCISFLVQSFKKMGYSQASEDEESDDSEDETRDNGWFDGEDFDTGDFGKKCLIRLAFLWPAHKEQIISAGGDNIVQAIRKFNRNI